MLKNKKFSNNFDQNAIQIINLHRNQTLTTVSELNNKYSKPVFGKIKLWDIIQKLSLAIDPTDKKLYGVSQWLHSLQVVESIQKYKLSEEFVLIGLLHDLGKVLLLTNELPENIVCDNNVIGEYPDGIGLDNCIFQWNHDEYAYMKLKNYLPEHLAKLIRYHSINPTVHKYFSQEDKLFHEKYLAPFRFHDKSTKSIYHLPHVNLDELQKLVEKWFPEEIEL